MEKPKRDRTQTEGALRASEERFRRILENAPFGYYRVGKDGLWQYVNSVWERMHGLSYEEVVGKSFEITQPEDAVEQARENVRRALAGETITGEFSRLRKDGTIEYHSFNIQPVYHHDEIVAIEGFISDITKQKKLAEKLWESEERYRALVDNTLLGITIIDTNHKILMTNAMFARAFNKPVSSFVGKDCFREFEKREAVCPHCPGVRAMASGKTVEVETEAVLDDGTRIPVHNRAIPFFGPGGVVKGFIELVEDISERKKAELALKDSRQRLADIIEFLPDATFAIDLEGSVIAWNKTIEEMTGIRAQDILGKGDYEYALPFYGERRPILIDLAIKSDEEAEKKYECIKRKGNTLIAEVYIPALGARDAYLWGKATPLYDLHGNIEGAIESVRDITERKQAEEKLQSAYNDILERQEAILNLTEDLKHEIDVRKEAEELIKASLKEKEVLLREINHRVKNNMQVITSLLRLQSRRIQDKEALEMFEDSCNRVRSMALIHEKLYQSEDMARIDFANYIKSLTGQLASTYPARADTVTVNTEIKDVLLDLNTAIPCGLIINELISNSLKHAFPNSSKGEINVVMHMLNNEKVELIVSDTGIGFPKDLDFRNTQSLGMQLLLSLAGQLEGTIELDRSSGTTFTITFRKPEDKKNCRKH